MRATLALLIGLGISLTSCDKGEESASSQPQEDAHNTARTDAPKVGGRGPSESVVEVPPKKGYPSPELATPEPKFEQVGYFKTGGMRGFTYYVENVTRKDIEAFCREQVRSYGDRILKIHFFDDKKHTPDVSSEYYFPDACQEYLVADYFNNPFNHKSDLKIHGESLK